MLPTEKISGLGREWLWPATDKKCREVIFAWASDISRVLTHVERREVVVQAGGNMGVWPWVLAKQFQRVHTFEADPLVWPFLQYNIKGLANVSSYHAALFSRPGVCGIGCDAKDVNNLGAQFVTEDAGEILMVTIDSFNLAACDLVYLDIEGAELDALKGARNTIDTFRPTIAVEDKGLSARFGTAQGAIAEWLKPFGYQAVGRYHRDTVFEARGRK
jgi:FkbM family methyltransferase